MGCISRRSAERRVRSFQHDVTATGRYCSAPARPRRRDRPDEGPTAAQGGLRRCGRGPAHPTPGPPPGGPASRVKPLVKSLPSPRASPFPGRLLAAGTAGPPAHGGPAIRASPPGPPDDFQAEEVTAGGQALKTEHAGRAYPLVSGGTAVPMAPWPRAARAITFGASLTLGAAARTPRPGRAAGREDATHPGQDSRRLR